MIIRNKIFVALLTLPLLWEMGLLSVSALPSDLAQSSLPETSGEPQAGEKNTSAAASKDANDVSLRLDLENRSIIFSALKLKVAGKNFSTDKEETVSVPLCQPKTVASEKIVFEKDIHGNLSSILSNCHANRFVPIAVPGMIVPGSINLKTISAEKSPTASDCDVNESIGLITLKSNSIQPTANIEANYSVQQARVDTVVIKSDGTLALLEGTAVNWAPQPPAVPADAYPLLNVYSSSARPLVASDIVPIQSQDAYKSVPAKLIQNKTALASFLNKAKAGGPLKIKFWGDSVTLGSGSTSDSAMFTNRVISGLTQMYPKCQTKGVNLGTGGANSIVRYKQFSKEVLSDNPDLVIVEFVNDMLLPVQMLKPVYEKVIDQAKEVGADVLICAPHLPLESFIPVKNESGVGSGPYRQFIRSLTRERQGEIAVIDVSGWSEGLPKMGLKAESFLVDGIHPSDAGHAVYADLILRSLSAQAQPAQSQTSTKLR